MIFRNSGKMLLLVLLFSFFSVLIINHIYERGAYHTRQSQTVENPEYRRLFYSDEMRKNRRQLSGQCRALLDNVEKEVRYFPVPESTLDRSLQVSFVDSWMAEREYKGTSGHEGTDIMAAKNERGVYPVLSMTEGTVTNMGWLEKGGYRVGVTSDSGTYYYYAHLDSYANVQEGDRVMAGELLGYMGDSGYGGEGTKGMFDVHVHVGIYSYVTGEEISVNPYYVLLALSDRKLEYKFR